MNEHTKTLWEDGVKKSIKDGANLNYYRTNQEEHPTILHNISNFKTQKGTEILEELLKSGANPNVLNVFGCNPLHFLALDVSEKYTEELTEIFCKYKTNVNLKSSLQETPLLMCCCYANHKVLKVLLKYGAEINTSDWSGKTPYSRLQNIKSRSEEKKICLQLLDEHSKKIKTKIPTTKSQILENTKGDSKIKSNETLLIQKNETKKDSPKETTQNEKKCNHCGKESKLRCGKCHSIYYCDQECQKKDWSSHKLKCSK